MTWVEPTTVQTWDVLEAEHWNQDVVDNTIALHDRIGMVPLASSHLDADSASVWFSDISQDYAALMLTGTARSTYASLLSWAYIRFNNDSGSGHYSYRFTGYPTPNPTSSAETFILLNDRVPAASSYVATANVAFKMLLPNYATSSWWKAVQYEVMVGDTGASYLSLVSGAGMWHSTAAVTQIIIASGSGSFEAGSSFTLWGMKGV